MKSTRVIKIGNTIIGGGNPVLVQSMTNTDTRNIDDTVRQILELESAGCDIIRSSVYDKECAVAFKSIKNKIHIPIVADIHFNHRLAIYAMENGADKIRINPGNIGSEDNVKQVVDCAKMHHVPIRIGVNAGSMEKDLREEFGAYSPDGMVKSILRKISLMEKMGFSDIVLSLKASEVKSSVAAYRRISEISDYPLHVGITETGNNGIIKSAVGIGTLLLDGIGDTIRVSLTDDPVNEVQTGIQILKALGIRKNDVEIISCPTCGRTRVDLFSAMKYVDQHVLHDSGYLKIAVMGCAVNGPGEASDADIGIAFGENNGLIFKNGLKYKSGRMPEILDVLIEEANKMIAGASR